MIRQFRTRGHRGRWFNSRSGGHSVERCDRCRFQRRLIGLALGEGRPETGGKKNQQYEGRAGPFGNELTFPCHITALHGNQRELLPVHPPRVSPRAKNSHPPAISASQGDTQSETGITDRADLDWPLLRADSGGCYCKNLDRPPRLRAGFLSRHALTVF